MTIIDAGLEFAYAPGRRAKSSELILHHAAGNGEAAAIHRLHLEKGWAGIAYHYYVRRDGSVFKGRPEDWRGGHTKNRSDALGICFEGNFEADTMPDAQLEAGRELISDVLGRYPGMCVYRHRDFDATACPGKNFPMGELLRAPGESAAPSGWAQSACEKAAARGIVEGDGSGGFGWREPLTLERALVLLDRLGIL